MRSMARTNAWVWVLLVVSAGCSSSSHQGDGSGSQGGGPFSNAASGPATGSSGSGSGSGSGATGTGNGNCADGLVRTSHVTPRVVLVLDGSCSMTTNYPANGAQSETQCRENPNGRWAALRNALIDPQRGVVTQLQNVVEFGVAVFGTQPQCPFPINPIGPALNNLQAIQNSLPTVQPGEYTPTGMALDMIYDALDTQQVDSDAGPEIVILATDGEPNSCGDARTDYQSSIDAVTKGQMKGIRTYIISLADSSGEFHDHLQQLANIGAAANPGTNAPLYEPTNPAELEADLQGLVGGAVGCDIALNGSVDTGQECQGSVKFNGTPLECNGPDGWVLTDPRHIRLQGKACDDLKAAGTGAIDAAFPCGVFTVD